MTATATTESRKMAAILQLIGWQRHAPLVCRGRMPLFLAGYLKKNDSGGWSNVFKTGLHWSKKQKARINSKEVAKKITKKTERASTGEGDETVLNNAMNYSESRARERRWNNTEQCREPKLMRAIERRRKYPTNWFRRLQNSLWPSSKFTQTWCCAAVQENSKVTRFGQVMNKRNQMCQSVLEKLQNSKRSGKKWLIHSSIENITSV